jgi:cytochrome d ubiquinol oxidase subunit II
MALHDVVLVIIWLGISAYGVFGGADFGGGVWDLFAGSAERGASTRRLIERVIGPVWEANHVWLIFVLVYLWTAFPEPFASIASTLYVPLALAGLGIIGRGAGFAFRKWADTTARAAVMGAVFAASSLLTPFFLGTVAGAVASGRVPLGNAQGDLWASWLNPTSILGGVMAILACAYLAAVLITRDAVASGDMAMAEYFRVRAMATGYAAGAVALAGVVIIRTDAPVLFDGLTSGLGVAFVVLSAAGGITSLWALRRHRFVVARVAAVTATVNVLWGWGAGQYPDVLPGQVTVAEAAASDPVLWALIGAFIAAGSIAVPALVYLLRLSQEGRLGESGGMAVDSTEALLKALESERIE